MRKQTVTNFLTKTFPKLETTLANNEITIMRNNNRTSIANILLTDQKVRSQ